MKHYLSRIEKIKKEFAIDGNEHFVVAESGTNHKVFLSDHLVIRFRDDNPQLLLRETKFLKKLNHPLIPKILQSGKIDQSFFMIENRLTGQTIDSVWRNLSADNKKNIIRQVVSFLEYQKTLIKNDAYSVKTGKKYRRFSDYLMENIKQKTTAIEKFGQADKIVKDILSIMDDSSIKNLFDNPKTTLVHGDLIIHNLLTDGKGLTGVLDWEMASLGDPDYDLCRLFYYQECAKAYEEQGADETFESDYMDSLMTAISESGLVKNRKIFQKKYRFARAVFYFNALEWAANSKSPDENIDELIEKWGKAGSDN